MKQYFRNLLIAFSGKNPLQTELTRIKEEYEKIAGDAKRLRDLYYECQERWGNTEKQLEECRRHLSDYQKLVENLRQRIVEKDDLMNRVKEDYQNRIREYNEEIEALRQKKEKNKTGKKQ